MASKSVTATELKNQLGQVIDRVVRGERLRVTRHRRVQFALVPTADLELLEQLDELRDARAAKTARRGKAKARPVEDVLRKLGL